MEFFFSCINSSGKNHITHLLVVEERSCYCCLITGAFHVRFSMEMPLTSFFHPYHPLHPLGVCKVHPSVAFPQLKLPLELRELVGLFVGTLQSFDSSAPENNCSSTSQSNHRDLYLLIRTVVLHARVYASIVVSSPFTTRRLSS